MSAVPSGCGGAAAARATFAASAAAEKTAAGKSAKGGEGQVSLLNEGGKWDGQTLHLKRRERQVRSAISRACSLS